MLNIFQFHFRILFNFYTSQSLIIFYSRGSIKGQADWKFTKSDGLFPRNRRECAFITYTGELFYIFLTSRGPYLFRRRLFSLCRRGSVSTPQFSSILFTFIEQLRCSSLFMRFVRAHRMDRQVVVNSPIKLIPTRWKWRFVFFFSI